MLYRYICLVSERVETPTQEARAHDPPAQLPRVLGTKEWAGKIHPEVLAPLSSVRNDSAGGTAVLVSGRQLCPGVPVATRKGGRRDETGTHVTVDLLRKSGLIWLGWRRGNWYVHRSRRWQIS